MKDHFSALGFSPCLVLDLETVEEAWREATREHAGDSGEEPKPPSSDDPLADIHEARAVLSDPVKRLSHWLALRGISPSRATTMDSEMMNLFGSLGEILAKTDEFLTRHAAASSALAKALLTKEAIAVQLELQEQMQQVQAQKQTALGRFPELESLASRNEFEAATSTLQQLQFLTKWEAQCQERLLSLLAC